MPLSNPFGARWGERTYVMGVLNVTPDSFSGDGVLGRPEEIARKALACSAAGADIVDIGGESTRPGHRPVPLEEELSRTVPAISAAREALRIPISVDTTKVEVARRAIEAGATIVNDVSGAPSPEMLQLVAETRAGMVLVHRGRPDGGDVVSTVLAGLGRLVDAAIGNGITREALVIDPGLGFGKTWKENFEIFRSLSRLRELGLPVLVGPSRKGMIGKVLGTDVHDRVEGTLALVALGIVGGVDAVRVHDIVAMSRAARMVDALVR